MNSEISGMLRHILPLLIVYFEGGFRQILIGHLYLAN